MSAKSNRGASRSRVGKKGAGLHAAVLECLAKDAKVTVATASEALEGLLGRLLRVWVRTTTVPPELEAGTGLDTITIEDVLRERAPVALRIEIDLSPGRVEPAEQALREALRGFARHPTTWRPPAPTALLVLRLEPCNAPAMPGQAPPPKGWHSDEDFATATCSLPRRLAQSGVEAGLSLQGQVDELVADLQHAKSLARERLQRFLDALPESSDLGGEDAKRLVATWVQAACDNFGFKVACPGREGEPCGKPSNLTVYRNRDAPKGRFRFTHAPGSPGAVPHTTRSTLPRLELVDAPPRRPA